MQPHSSSPTRDWGFLAIVGLVAGIAIWVMLMPWVPAIATATMRRFHLASSSFVTFAIQFPIPAMYNFSNRCEVRKRSPDQTDVVTPFRHYNHFPARIVTFSNTRWRHLKDRRPASYILETSYRGKTLRTRVAVESDRPGKCQVIAWDLERS